MSTLWFPVLYTSNYPLLLMTLGIPKDYIPISVNKNKYEDWTKIDWSTLTSDIL